MDYSKTITRKSQEDRMETKIEQTLTQILFKGTKCTQFQRSQHIKISGYGTVPPALMVVLTTMVKVKGCQHGVKSSKYKNDNTIMFPITEIMNF